jgi:ferric-dicitrate binding protein FerR (iron transport regulator)
LKETGPSEHRLALARGEMHALVSAPPRLFFVDTPAATAVDLGCAYTLTVDESGGGQLHVTLGYVALEGPESEVVIPARAKCDMRPGRRIGTPYTEEASSALQAALRQLDFGGDDSSLAAHEPTLGPARPH